MDLDQIIKDLLRSTLNACKLIRQADSEVEKETILASVNFTAMSQQLILEAFYNRTAEEQDILIQDMETEIEKQSEPRIQFKGPIKPMA